MESMFHDSKFNENITTWDTRNVIRTKNMFRNAILFNRDISQWNTSSIKIASGMFSGAREFNYLLDLWTLHMNAKPVGMFTGSKLMTENGKKYSNEFANRFNLRYK
jgi:hypothetical protein